MASRSASRTTRTCASTGTRAGCLGIRRRCSSCPITGSAPSFSATSASPIPFVYEQFQQKLFEILFDGRDEAREDLTLALKDEEAWTTKENSKIDFAPDRAFLERFVGTYEHPMHGKVTIRVDGKVGILDAGEWTTTLGKKKEEDGTEKLVATENALALLARARPEGGQREDDAGAPGGPAEGRVRAGEGREVTPLHSSRIPRRTTIPMTSSSMTTAPPRVSSPAPARQAHPPGLPITSIASAAL